MKSLVLGLILAAGVAHAQEKPTLEEAAKQFKPTYSTNYSTDMAAFMKNTAIYSGLGFIYVNPKGVSPDITQTVVFNTNLVKVPVTTTTTVQVPYTYTVPVTTTWTTTSVVVKEVVSPYTIISSTNSWNLTAGDASGVRTINYNDLVNALGQLDNTYQASNATFPVGAGIGTAAQDYWVKNGLPQSPADIQKALQICANESASTTYCYSSVYGVSNWPGATVDPHAGTINTTNGWTSVTTTGGSAPYTQAGTPTTYFKNGVKYEAKDISTTYYSSTEDRWRTRVVRVVDSNQNGVFDEGDQIMVADVHEGGTNTTAVTTESGTKTEYHDETVTEEHSETHNEERSGTREETRTETHDEEKSETTSQVVQNKKNVWKFSFSPILSLDIQTPVKITSLDSQFSFKEVGPSGVAKSLEIASEAKGFMVEKKSAVTAAVGAAVAASYSAWTPGTALTLGMAPIVGTDKTYKTVVKTRAEADAVSVPAVPSTLADLQKLKVGDSLSYAQVGGVMFTAGAAYVVVNVGVNLIAIGQWKTEIQKISDTRYYVNRSAVKMNNFGAAVGSTLTLAYSVSDFKSRDSQFSWLFDTSDAKAAKALENFVFKGIALDAQSLADSKGQTTVLAVMKQDNVSKGALRAVSLGLPYMTASWSKGKINTTQISQYFPDSTLGEANYAVYMKARDGRMFNWIENSTVAFTGARYDVKDANTKKLQESGYYGQFAFSYTDTHTKDYELQAAVNQLVAVTGMYGELYVNIPKSPDSSKAWTLGSSQVQFVLTFDKAATDFLMALATDRVASAKLERDAQQFLTGYVRGNKFDRAADRFEKDPIKMCGTVYSYHTDACVRQAQDATLNATGEVIVNLRDMKAALAQNDKVAFANAYAALGKAMTESPFTFQAVTGAAIAGTAGKGVSANYSINGSRIKNLVLSPSWDAGLVNQVFPLKK